MEKSKKATTMVWWACPVRNSFAEEIGVIFIANFIVVFITVFRCHTIGKSIVVRGG